MSLSPGAQHYLKDVWGYERVEDVDPLTYGSIAENCEIAEDSGQEWPLDFEIRDAVRNLRTGQYPVIITFAGQSMTAWVEARHYDEAIQYVLEYVDVDNLEFP